MEKTKYVPQIPYGTRDILPAEARYKRDIENGLAELFSLWGYNEVVTPTMEYLETLAVGTGSDIEQHLFKFFDKNNSILALRADMTSPIARMAATRFKDSTMPIKLFYLTNVFRYEQAQAGRQCEFYQAGVELLGVPGPMADAEVVALAVEAMLKSGLKQFQINLGQVDFINGIMDESELSVEQRQQVKHAMLTRNLVGLSEILENSGLKDSVKNFLKQIPLLHGREDMLKNAYAMVNNETSRKALDNLNDIYQLLKTYGVDKYVYFDLGIIRDFDYYTGMVLEGYTPGLGFPVCGGGRYDNMLSSFGKECPATGFALGIERILLALERQGIVGRSEEKDVYIGWSQTKRNEAISAAAKLRNEGQTVEIALVSQSKEEAIANQLAKGYKQIIYIGD